MSESKVVVPQQSVSRRKKPQRADLPVRYLGHVFVVQGPMLLTSLVRVRDGKATCDCNRFRVKRICAHIASVGRHFGGGHD
jgi:hypothetical protein